MAVNVFATGASNDNISRNDLVNWINQKIVSSYSKIEEMCSGVAYCHLLDMLFENCVAIKRVKFLAKNEVDYLTNWKVLQNGLKKVGIDKTIPVDKLTKGKFQDNFEFCQWFKKFFDANYGGHEYDALAVRGGVQLPINSKMGKPNTMKTSSKPSTISKSNDLVVNKRTNNNTTISLPKPTTPKLPNKFDNEKKDILVKIAALKIAAEGSENERDFYFRKLQDIEVLAKDGEEEAPKLSQRILEILYQPGDDDKTF